MDPDELLDSRQTAEWLKLAPVTLDVWRTKGKGPPHIRLGTRAVRYRRRDVQAWLDSQTCATGAAA